MLYAGSKIAAKSISMQSTKTKRWFSSVEGLEFRVESEDYSVFASSGRPFCPQPSTLNRQLCYLGHDHVAQFLRNCRVRVSEKLDYVSESCAMSAASISP